MIVRRFEAGDAKEVSDMIRRNFLEVNIKDYPEEEMQELADGYSPEKVISISRQGHTYVVGDEGRIVGTGTVQCMQGSLNACILLAIFVMPEYHARGVGRMILETLEKDTLFSCSDRVELHASITAVGFYEKMGYRHMSKSKEANEDGVYLMEKVLS